MKYNCDNIGLEEKKLFLKEFKDKAFSMSCQILDCKKSVARKDIDMSFEEIIEKFNDKSLFTIFSRSFDQMDNKKGNYIEICFSTMNSMEPDYFLYLSFDISYEEDILKRINKC